MSELEDRPLHEDDYGEDGRVRLEKTDLDVEEWEALPRLLVDAANVLTAANHAYGENSIRNVRAWVEMMLESIDCLADTSEMLLGRKRI